MATRRKMKVAKLKAHIQAICDLIDESDASMTGGEDNSLTDAEFNAAANGTKGGADDTPDLTPRVGGMDAGRGRSMSEGFKNFDRIRRGY